MQTKTTGLFCLLLLLVITALPLMAGESSGYKLPPQEIIKIVDAPMTPSVSLSPNKEWMLIAFCPGLPSLKQLSKPELRIGGLRFNPETFSPKRGWYYDKLVLKNIHSGQSYEVKNLPREKHLTNLSWSPDSKKIAFTQTTDNALNLWMATIDDFKAVQVSELALNDVSDSPFRWHPSSAYFIVKAVPHGDKPAPEKSPIPDGPIIRENIGGKAPARTYQDLLKNKYDEELFTYYMTSQLYTLSFEGKAEKIGTPDLYQYYGYSPDGEYLLIEKIHPPFSYIVPYSRFPLKSEVWDNKGHFVYQIADLPLAENIPIAYGSTRTGRRSIAWRADAPATLYWIEALDDGDASKEAEYRDKVVMLAAPFTAPPGDLISLNLRYRSIEWGNGELAIVNSYWWKTRNIKTWVITPDHPEKEPRILFDRSREDRYNDPGSPMTTRNDYGRSVLLTSADGQKLYFEGTGASPEGDRPFIDEFDINTKATKRLFQSQAPYYEEPYAITDLERGRFIISRESVTSPPNYILKSFNNDNMLPLTNFSHPTPTLQNVQKEVIRYERDDGVKLMADLYLPPGYTKDDGPLPMLMWAYPREFKSAAAASQVKGSPYKFIRVSWRSSLIWLSLGYAVLNGPTMPIIGEGDAEPNDTFVKQLVASAQAAVDEVVKRGVADPNRIAIGGHSYGAFMTANLLAHSDLFRLGIARSGAYNRTLTPFGFQSEERTLWDAPEIYFAMSPFMHAEKINEPILLIHGEADNNSGTYPMQSERFYSALKGHGATVRLVMLPNESHGYRARESVLHMLYESAEWLDKYVKNAPMREI